MRKCAFFTVLCFLITSGLTFTAKAGGKLVYQSIYSDALKNNLLGDAAYRSVIVYLPPGYDQSQKRYPTIYLLHGYNDTNTIWRDGFFQGFSIPPVMDRLIEQGKIQEMIVVMPDGRNAYGGSYYINSSVTGKWEDFIVKDLPEFVDQNYRTLPSNESRGIAGHSMGGYGAIFLAARYPDIYSAVYGLSACCLSMLGDVTSSNRVIVKSGVWHVESSGDLVNLCYLDSIFEFHTGNHLRQVIESP